MKDKKKRKPATPMEVHCPDYDIKAILNDPKLEEEYQKHYKGDKLYQDTSDVSDYSSNKGEVTAMPFSRQSTKDLELCLKVIRGGNEPGETQSVGDKIEKELNRRKHEDK